VVFDGGGEGLTAVGGPGSARLPGVAAVIVKNPCPGLAPRGVIGADRTVPYFAATPVSAITAESVENFIAAKRSPLGSARCGIGSWSGSCLSMADYVAMTPPTDEAIRCGIGFLERR
jgi:hypothetical protein